MEWIIGFHNVILEFVSV